MSALWCTYYVHVYVHVRVPYNIGRVLIAWFNDYVLGKSGQIMNPIIVKVDPQPYYRIVACFMFVNQLITSLGITRNSQLIDSCN